MKFQTGCSGFSIDLQKESLLVQLLIPDVNSCMLILMENLDNLEPLLELNGIEYCIVAGYWVKFSAIKITPNEHRPFGIKYSLSMHNVYGTRLVGFDNAHLADIKRKKYAAKRVVWDHKHNRGVVSDYDFDSADQLIEDFWNLVDQVLTEEGISS